MKVVILAGGFGSRISEESHLKPKPMIEIGGTPILWHIMKIYYQYGFNEFIICAGYKQNVIKDYFSNYFLYQSDVTFDFTTHNKISIHNHKTESWKVTIVDTGLNTMTGGRLKRIRDYIGKETFMMTYGDGVCDVDLRKLLDYHKSHNKLATITAIQPRGRFGTIEIQSDNRISRFAEKKTEDVGWINAGFMVLEPEVLDFIPNDETTFEKEPLERLSEEGQLMAYCHKGFWQCMDTMRDKQILEELLEKGQASWKTWKE